MSPTLIHFRNRRRAASGQSSEPGSAVARWMGGLDELAGLDMILCAHPMPVQAGWPDVAAAGRLAASQARDLAALLRETLSAARRGSSAPNPLA